MRLLIIVLLIISCCILKGVGHPPKKEIVYTSNNEGSIVFFSHIATSTKQGISLWKGLKIRYKSGSEKIVINPSESQILISDAIIGKSSVCSWSKDSIVFLFHLSYSFPEVGIDKLNVLNCVENPLTGIDIKGSAGVVYAQKKDSTLNLASINTCKGGFAHQSHDYELDILNDEEKYEIVTFKLIRELFLNDFNKVESGIKKGNKDVINDVFTNTILKDYLLHYPINSFNQSYYNNLGYYFEQQQLYVLAIATLTKVVDYNKKRTVAYLNLGDAYFGLKNSVKAKQAYNTYISLMKKSGKEAKIPKRVFDRVK